MNPLDTLRHHVTGAIERGEKTAVTEIPRYQVIVDNVGTVHETNNGFVALREWRRWIRASRDDGGRAQGETVTLMRDGAPWREYELRRPQWFVEVTDVYGGEANYCWVSRYLVHASTMRGAMGKVPGYAWRKNYDTGDMARYNAIGAAVCAFIEWADPDIHNADHYPRIEVI
jgi:hypothetical protein